jgi:hypothetical protein
MFYLALGFEYSSNALFRAPEPAKLAPNKDAREVEIPMAGVTNIAAQVKRRARSSAY